MSPAPENITPASVEPTPRAYTVRELAEHLGAPFDGEAETPIHAIASLELAGPGELAFLAEKRMLQQARATRAGALLVSAGLEPAGDFARICVPDARAAFQRVAMLFHPPCALFPPGIHPSACIAVDAAIAEGVHIGPQVTIGARSTIAAGVTIRAGVRIDEDVEISAQSYIYPNVVLGPRVRIGRGVIVQPGAVIGSDGYGYARSGENHDKIPQIGGVLIEDDVEIGANCCIDRGTLGDTVIGAGTKIDNLVHIAHNVHIGRSVLIIAQVGISGSTRVGDHAVLAGQAGLVGHLEIGARAMIGAQAGVIGDVPAGATYWGYPAVDHGRYLKAYARFLRLPEIERRLRRIERDLAGPDDDGDQRE